ncbi:MAG TPA: hypothetical protein VMZ53_06765 [Kofleriaceae bacterium]|nr:hypothetical protein [Kofleriaceae bacterium]
MRNLLLSVAAMLSIAAVACGPSSKEVAGAKSARYQGDKLELFANVRAATEAKYKITKSDETTLGLQTEPRWFSVEGLAVTPRANDDMTEMPDKSINIALVVTMLPDGDAWLVKVTPVMARYNRGIPKPEQVKEGDASLPGWVDGKVDELSLEIHKKLAKWEVKTVPGQLPPPAPNPDQQPPAQTPPAPEAGSPAPAPQ